MELLYLKKLKKEIKKSFEKVLTMLFKDDIVLLVLKKRDNEKRKNEL
jgi:hypothetical protein